MAVELCAVCCQFILVFKIFQCLGITNVTQERIKSLVSTKVPSDGWIF